MGSRFSIGRSKVEMQVCVGGCRDRRVLYAKVSMVIFCGFAVIDLCSECGLRAVRLKMRLPVELFVERLVAMCASIVLLRSPAFSNRLS